MKLACIVPIFNFLGDATIEANHAAAIAKLAEPTVDIYPIRAVAHSVPQENDFIAPTHSILWQKEALINYAISQLFTDYDAIAWIDSGIYLEPGWSHRVLRALETYDVVQCYNEGVWLNPKGDVSSTRDGYVHNLLKGIQQQRGKPKPSVGAAWAAKSETLKHFRLYDRAIVGGGDTWFLNGVLGVDTPEALVTRHQTEAQRTQIGEWIENTRAKRFRVGYTIDKYTHLWHMDPDQRQHTTRHKILVNHDFNPELCTQVAPTGTLEWTPMATPGLIEDVKKFLTARVSPPEYSKKTLYKPDPQPTENQD